MTKQIYCGEFTKNSFYLLGVTISYSILGLSKTYASKGLGGPFDYHPFFAEILMFIVYVIQQKIYSTKVVYKKTKRFSTSKVALYITALTLGDMLSTFAGNLFVIKGVNNFDSLFKVIYFITTCILMKIVMKHSYYMHHWIGICSQLGSAIILTFVSVYHNKEKT